MEEIKAKDRNTWTIGVLEQDGKNREITGLGLVNVNLSLDFMASAVFGLVNIQEYNVFNCTLQFYLNFSCIYSRLSQCCFNKCMC